MYVSVYVTVYVAAYVIAYVTVFVIAYVTVYVTAYVTVYVTAYVTVDTDPAFGDLPVTVYASNELPACHNVEWGVHCPDW